MVTWLGRLLSLSLLLIAGCDRGGTSSEARIERQTMRVSIRPSADLSAILWRGTRFIQIGYRTSQGREILDSLVPAEAGSIALPPLSMEFGATLDLEGRDSLGTPLWTATTRLSAEPSPSTAVRTIELLANAPSAPPFRTGIAPPPILVASREGDSLRVELLTTQGVAIHYTLDGLNPTIHAPRFVTSFLVASNTRIRAIALNDSLYPSKVLDTTLLVGTP